LFLTSKFAKIGFDHEGQRTQSRGFIIVFLFVIPAQAGILMPLVKLNFGLKPLHFVFLSSGSETVQREYSPNFVRVK
jgi:hypothetical protein